MNAQKKCELFSPISLKDISWICAAHDDEPNFSLKFKMDLQPSHDLIRIPKIAEFIIGVNQQVELYSGKTLLGTFAQTSFPKLYLLGLYNDFYVKPSCPFVTVTFETVPKSRAENLFDEYKNKYVISDKIILQYDHGTVTSLKKLM
ncbi:MAG TPA: hypothetical protein VLE02_01965 [Nitrosarchaeum sp.]|nr:hypothetical protein [Nitrosarchaeum sp.]